MLNLAISLLQLFTLTLQDFSVNTVELRYELRFTRPEI